jgi:erythromycin esterase
MFLKNYIGDSKIVALGEGTHGTSEFFKMKHRMMEFLAKEMGFTLFGLEANMPECRAINRYILHGEGDPRKALDGIYFWTWNTQEVLDMIEWMRRYNLSASQKIHFYGIDMQFAEVALANVEEFFAVYDPANLSFVKGCYDTIRSLIIQQDQSFYNNSIEPDYQTWISEANKVINLLKANKHKYLSNLDPVTVEWVIQDATIVLQTASNDKRDQYMADNVNWILDQWPPGTKIVLWAHNMHVSRRINFMGNYLHQQYDEDVKIFGFCFHEGRYTARGDWGLDTFDAEVSDLGSIEWAFHRTGYPRMMLDLNKASVADSSSSWLHEVHEFRNIGARAMERAFFPTLVTDLYDVLVFFDKTNPSRVLKVKI